MSVSPESQRTMAEVDFDQVTSSAAKIGNRSMHQFWHLFSAQFRGVLLAPQRRPESGKVSWVWREPAGARPFTVQELAEVRRRLTVGNRSLAGGLMADEDEVGGTRSIDAQVRASVSTMVGQLLGLSDQALTGYVCRTETGPMLHSWGAAMPAKPFVPDSQQGEVTGTVFVNGKPTVGVTVMLETNPGQRVARTKSDGAGSFRFQGVEPGRYRLRVADRSDFSPTGLAITVEREAVTGLELRGGNDPAANTESTVGETTARRRRWPAWLGGGLLVLAVVGAGVWYFRQRPSVQSPSVAPVQASSWQTAKGGVTGASAPTIAPRAMQQLEPEKFTPAGLSVISTAQEDPSVVVKSTVDTAAAFPPPEVASAEVKAEPSSDQGASGQEAKGEDFGLKRERGAARPEKVGQLVARPGKPGQESVGATEGDSQARAAAVSASGATSTGLEAPTPVPPAPTPVARARAGGASKTTGENSADSATTAIRATTAAESTSRVDEKPEPAAANSGGTAVGGRRFGEEKGELLMKSVVEAGAWRTALVVDAILPTQPLLVKQGLADVKALREKQLTAARARMPTSFQMPVMASGIVLELSEANAIDGLRWRDAEGHESEGGFVAGNRAEVGWAGARPVAGGESVLSGADGRVWARVGVNQRGGLTLTTVAGTRSWYWVGIEPVSAERGKKLFAWRLWSGEALPAGAVIDGSWREGRGHRIELPLGGRAAGEVSYPLALVETESGWALTATISLR